MKKNSLFLTILLFIVLGLVTKAQTGTQLEWAKQIGSSGYDYPRFITLGIVTK